MTAIPYPDLTADSPRGRCRFEARSPDNDPASPRPVSALDANNPRRFWTNGFQSDFVYIVRDAGTGEVLWRRAQARDECGPAGAWVHDGGWAVVITRGPFTSEVLLFSPRGERLLRLDAMGDILGGGEEEFRWTSAGPDWHEDGHGYFAASGGREYWCLRTVYGRRVVLDLAAAAHRAGSAAPAADLEAAERRWALDTLTAAAGKVTAWGPEVEGDAWDELREVRIAAHVAGCLGLREAAPLLRALEPVPVRGGYSHMPWLEGGEKVSVCLVRLPLRRMVQMSLRRLGERPAGYAPHGFILGERDGPTFDVPECLPDRERVAAEVGPGWSPQEVLRRLGAPDNATRWEWEYHLGDGSDPYTLEIRWDDGRKVIDSTGCVRPPTWQVPPGREFLLWG